MARDDNKKTELEGQAAIERWLKGVDAWNKWVEENPVADVSFAGADFSQYNKVSFMDYIFPKGDVRFNNAQFGEGEVDFEGAQFGEGDVRFNNAQFGEGGVSFFKAKFGEGDVSFFKAQFGEGDVSFSNAQFGEGDVSFSNAQFGEGYVRFSNAQFGEGDVSFFNAQFGEGDVSFFTAKFGEGDVSFNNAQFGEGEVDFAGAQFGEGCVSFNNAQFGEGDVSFYYAQLGEGYVNFATAKFGDGDVSFFKAKFGDGGVNFFKAKFGEGDVDFTDVQFGEGSVNFSRAQFGEGDVNFLGAQFGEGDVNFSNVQFGMGDVSFESIKLSGQFNFMDVTRTERINSLSFKFATFDGPLCLDNHNFNCVPDFTNTKLSHQLSLSHFTVSNKLTHKGYLIPHSLIILKKLWFGSELKHSKIKSSLKLSKKLSKKLPWLSKTTAADKQDIDRLRRLKELAETNKHHKLALDLHIEEMKSSRWIETTSKRALLAEFLFEKFGDYGRSIQRPLLGITFLGFLCSPIYYYSSSVKNPLWSDAIYYSFSQMLHLIPSSRTGRSELAKRLFEKAELIPNHIFLLSWSQSLASIALVFLLGLALRNRFRI
ncbi:hypothetical protein [Pseudoalteromonas obscura]|uniref:Pentapeptide repeat-containing protein n=1 Tax=Pseudoalteromonas obscura TaxID=3048491 RepID=A0ABT7EGQ0_9GAMM|nr:hypothetical protein [Pseudoalteromonas sp. P94(2023)]MDK2594226.1 hypothetical protein [Pseudoalteromonas sp. P94(2023)]